MILIAGAHSHQAGHLSIQHQQSYVKLHSFTPDTGTGHIRQYAASSLASSCSVANTLNCISSQSAASPPPSLTMPYTGKWRELNHLPFTNYALQRYVSSIISHNGLLFYVEKNKLYSYDISKYQSLANPYVALMFSKEQIFHTNQDEQSRHCLTFTFSCFQILQRRRS